ncbi:hypothetical protein ACFY12_34370 [Streptomyces sp. NPDC001339]|uniref:hypothetical protein n=1 Tax=Streptomyces sp. NPDC001339 TaxID=3364563 RepID=UPI00368E9E61
MEPPNHLPPDDPSSQSMILGPAGPAFVDVTFSTLKFWSVYRSALLTNTDGTPPVQNRPPDASL